MSGDVSDRSRLNVVGRASIIAIALALLALLLAVPGLNRTVEVADPSPGSRSG